jgi:hypothetical protein
MGRLGKAYISVFVVWIPILPDDDAVAAARAARSFDDDRVTHYWDGDRALGFSLGEALALPPRDPGRRTGVAWDVYLLFGRGARWGEALPVPSFWMHQLDDVPASRAPRLDGAVLKRRVEGLMSEEPPR